MGNVGPAAAAFLWVFFGLFSSFIDPRLDQRLHVAGGSQEESPTTDQTLLYSQSLHIHYFCHIYVINRSVRHRMDTVFQGLNTDYNKG